MHQIKKPWSIHPGLTLEFLDWIPPQIFASQPCHPSTTTATIRAMLRLATSAALLGLGVAIPWRIPRVKPRRAARPCSWKVRAQWDPAKWEIYAICRMIRVIMFVNIHIFYIYIYICVCISLAVSLYLSLSLCLSMNGTHHMAPKMKSTTKPSFFGG